MAKTSTLPGMHASRPFSAAVMFAVLAPLSISGPLPSQGPERFLLLREYFAVAATLKVSASRPPERLASVALAFLNAEDPEVRGLALTLAARLGIPKAFPALRKAMADPNPEIRRRALIGLGEFGGSRARLVLGNLLNSRNRESRDRALAALALGLGSPNGEADSLLGAALSDLLVFGTRSTDHEYAGCLAGFSKDGGRAAMIHFLKYGNPERVQDRRFRDHRLQAFALYTLARRVASREGFVRLRSLGLRNDSDPDMMRAWAWRGLALRGKKGDRDLERRLVETCLDELRGRKESTAGSALLALANLNPDRATELARKALSRKNSPPSLRIGALILLGRVGGVKDLERVRNFDPFRRQEKPEDVASLGASRILAAARIWKRLREAAEKREKKRGKKGGPGGDGKKRPKPPPASLDPRPEMLEVLHAPLDASPLLPTRRAAALGLALCGGTIPGTAIDRLLDRTPDPFLLRLLSLLRYHLTPIEKRKDLSPEILAQAGASELWDRLPLPPPPGKEDLSPFPKDRVRRALRLAALGLQDLEHCLASRLFDRLGPYLEHAPFEGLRAW